MKVINLKTDLGLSNVAYIGRPSKWGNPFIIGAGGNGRMKVIEKHREKLINDIISGSLRDNDFIDLRKADYLGCFCKPKACHGDFILEICQLGIQEHKCNNWLLNYNVGYLYGSLIEKILQIGKIAIAYNNRFSLEILYCPFCGTYLQRILG